MINNSTPSPLFWTCMLQLFVQKENICSNRFWALPIWAMSWDGRALPGVSGNSRSHPFPRMKASDSCSRIVGMDFVIPLMFPNFGNAFFSFPSRSRIMGMVFFHSLPVPELWEWIFFIPFPFPNFGNRFFHSLPIPEFWEWFFSFPSRSRIEGMGFFNSLPVPKLREWNYPFTFPFPNSQMSFPLTPDASSNIFATVRWLK